MRELLPKLQPFQALSAISRISAFSRIRPRIPSAVAQVFALQGRDFAQPGASVRYGDLEKPPQILPSGYAALLCLYRLR